MEKKIDIYQATTYESFFAESVGYSSKRVEEAVTKLEESFSKSCASEFILSTNNPSSAIHLAFCALDLKRGDKVICAVNSFVDIPESIRHFDSEPLFVDIDPESFLIDLHALESKLKEAKSKKLRAIVVTHFAGLYADMEAIMALAKSYNVAVIEDFSDAPTLHKYRGVYGDIAIFSLNFRLDNTLKGAVLSFKEQKHFTRAKLLREHGLKESNQDVSYLYDIVDIGCDYRLDNLSAFLLLETAAKREAMVRRKEEIATIYFKELADTAHITLPQKSQEGIYNYFIIKIDKNRDAFARELKQRGVSVGLHYIPLNFTSYYKEKYGLKIFNFPNALHVYQTVMSLPCHAKMSDEDVYYVARMVKEVASKHI